MTTVRSIHTLTADLPPSCVAFCPAKAQYFVVGTYFLHPKQDGQDAGSIEDDNVAEETSPGSTIAETGEKEQRRTGSLLLYELVGDEIRLIGIEDLPAAVLDIQWNTSRDAIGVFGSPVLAVATSTGTLAFYCLQTDQGVTCLRHYSTKIVCDEQTLVLSLQWHPVLTSVVGVTLSDGRVCVCQTSSTAPWNEAASVTVTEVAVHELEAWTLSFAPPSPSSSLQAKGDGRVDRLLSGGDDLALHCTEIQDLSTPVPRWQDRKTHQAGVTAILPLPNGLVITGSYDDNIRLLAPPAAGGRRCRVLAESHLGGGVWRLKLLVSWQGERQEGGPQTIFTVLASCMHAGSRVLQLICRSIAANCSLGESETHAGIGAGDGQDCWEFRVLAKFEEHRSMNYGSDVQPQLHGERRVKTIVSTSFYDKLLCLWRVDLDDLSGE